MNGRIIRQDVRQDVRQGVHQDVRGGQGLEAGQARPETRPAQQKQVKGSQGIDLLSLPLKSHQGKRIPMQFPEQRADGFACLTDDVLLI